MAGLDDLRTFARSLIAVQNNMTREEFIEAVLDYARRNDGDELWAARTARHVWDSTR